MVMSMPPFGGCFNIVYWNYLCMVSSGSLVVNRFKVFVNESGPSCTAGASRADAPFASLSARNLHPLASAHNTNVRRG